MNAKHVLQVIGNLQAERNKLQAQVNKSHYLQRMAAQATSEVQGQLEAAFATIRELQGEMGRLRLRNAELENVVTQAQGAIGQRDGAIQEAHRLKAKLDSLERDYDEIEEARKRNALLYHAEVKKNQELEDKIAGLKGDCIEMVDAMDRMELEMKQEEQ